MEGSNRDHYLRENGRTKGRGWDDDTRITTTRRERARGGRGKKGYGYARSRERVGGVEMKKLGRDERIKKTEFFFLE